MDDIEVKQLILNIINKAQEGQAQPFRDILYWSEYGYYRRWIRSTRIVIRTLKASADNLYKDYCKDVIAGISEFSKLLAYLQLLDIAAFYENDLNTIQQMIDEYEEYLYSGNFWYSFLGGRREG